MLEELLRQPGEVLTREALVAKLWPETFVDYQSGLNTVINRLRAALGDSADSPRYIETLPRLGYRFVHPVRVECCGSESKLEGENPPPLDKVSTLAAPAAGQTSPALPRHLYRQGSYAAIAAFAMLALLILITYRFPGRAAVPRFRPVTMSPGHVLNARFLPSKDQLAITASTDSGDSASFLVDLKHPGPQKLPFFKGWLASVSPHGEFAVISARAVEAGSSSVLSRVSSEGGSHPIAADVRAADWDSAGSTLAVIKERDEEYIVEFPPKHVIYRTSAWVDCIRVSPRNDRVALLEHATRNDDAGHIRVLRADGVTTEISPEWSSVRGLAWSRSGDEVWTSGSKGSLNRALFALSATTGLVREVSSSPSSLNLFDIGRSGSVLVSLEDQRMTMLGYFADEPSEHDLSKFEYSHVEDISADGNLILFTVAGQTGSDQYRSYVFDHRTRQTKLLAEGRGFALSADGKLSLSANQRKPENLQLTEVSTGNSRFIAGAGFSYQWARFLPGGEELLAGGSYGSGALGLFRQRLDGGVPQRIPAAPYLDNAVAAPSQWLVAGTTGALNIVVLDVRSGKTIHKLSCGFPAGWSRDAETLFILRPFGRKDEIVRHDLTTAVESLWKKIGPDGGVGFEGLGAIAAAPEAGAYAYSAAWSFAHLFVVDGWS